MEDGMSRRWKISTAGERETELQFKPGHVLYVLLEVVLVRARD